MTPRRIDALDAAFVAYLHGDITLAEFESLEDALRPDYAAIARALAATQRDVPWWRRLWRWFR